MDDSPWFSVGRKRAGAVWALPSALALTVCVPLMSVTHAQALPPVSARMLGKAVSACILVTDSGSIGGAYLLGTSGDKAADDDMLTWVKQLHWAPAKPGEKMRNVWFATGLAFGDAKAPEAASACSPPDEAPNTHKR